LLSFVESAPRAYRLKASNAAPPISTSIGTIPRRSNMGLYVSLIVALGLMVTEASAATIPTLKTDDGKTAFGCAH
jgi:hypothetical protein